MEIHKSSPECNRIECFGCEEGHCFVLAKKISKKECPFFKTREQVAQEKEYCRKRMAELRIKEK
jgi:hypothetical protein